MPVVGVGPPAAPEPGTGWRATRLQARQRTPQSPCSPFLWALAPARRRTTSTTPRIGTPAPSAGSERRRNAGGWREEDAGTAPRRRWAGPGAWRPGRRRGLRRACRMAPGRHATGPAAGRGTLKVWPGRRSSGSLPEPDQWSACTPEGWTPPNLWWHASGPRSRCCALRYQWQQWWSLPSCHPVRQPKTVICRLKTGTNGRQSLKREA